MGPEYNPEIHTATIESPCFRTCVIAVESLQQACLAADKMILDGIQVIEICGGFNSSDSKEIVKHINGAVPVGHICFTDGEEIKIAALLDR